MLWYQITRPFAFLRIKNSELMVLRTTIPAIITLALCLIYFVIPYKPDITGDKRYVDYVLQIVGALPGFYIAALAAAATFTNNSLDEEMSGSNVPTLEIRRGGETFSVSLTLRVFMCHLFAYLCVLSFVTCLFGILIMEFAPIFRKIGEDNKQLFVMPALSVVSYIFVGWFTFCILRIFTVTLHGLYFLVERMHQQRN